MSTLKEFKEKILSAENPFLLNDGYGKILCVKVPIGEAEYIYTMREYLDGKEIVTNISEEMNMTAILKNGIIYMHRPYEVMDRCDEEYPENVYRLDDKYMDKVNSQIKERVIDVLYSILPVVPLSESEEQRCRREARKILTYKKDINEYISHRQDSNIDKISIQKFADSLCGIVDLERETRENFENMKRVWIELKSSIERVKEIVFEKPEEILEKYEMDIINGLHTVDCKTVQVEFLYDGKTATGKIERDKLLHIVNMNDFFSSYNFTTTKGGEKIIRELGVGTYRSDKKELLTCKHINKITYGKKVLYQRTA